MRIPGTPPRPPSRTNHCMCASNEFEPSAVVVQLPKEKTWASSVLFGNSVVGPPLELRKVPDDASKILQFLKVWLVNRG